MDEQRKATPEDWNKAHDDFERKMSTKHTPGPWEINLHGPPPKNVDRFDVGPLGRVDGVAQVKLYADMAREEAEANARLIAAAPTMYEALEAICDSGVPMSDELTDMMLAAIRKARGEG